MCGTLLKKNIFVSMKELIDLFSFSLVLLLPFLRFHLCFASGWIPVRLRFTSGCEDNTTLKDHKTVEVKVFLYFFPLLIEAVLWIRNDFCIRILLFSWFRIWIRILFRILPENFLIFLFYSILVYSYSCKCVRN